MLGFIGAGNMASAIIAGAVGGKRFGAGSIIAYDPDGEKLKALEKMGVARASGNAEIMESCETVILSVKPQIIGRILSEIAGHAAGRTLVSIAAGITSGYIMSRVPECAGVIRVMPNTPLMIGCGATAIALNASVPLRVMEEVAGIFRASGDVEFIEERLMNEVTAVNGSSPAYFFRFIRAMADSAEKMGIERDCALRLAAKSMEGAAKMLLSSGRTPDELINAVTSPNGTTYAASLKLDELGFDEVIDSAMCACAERAYELSAAAD